MNGSVVTLLCLLGSRALAFVPPSPLVPPSPRSRTPELCSTIDRSQVQTSPSASGRGGSSSDQQGNAPIDVCIENLGKRLKGGPGTLSRDEVETVDAALRQIIDHVESSGMAEQNEGSKGDDNNDLRTAILEMDGQRVSSLIESGAEMSESDSELAFWAVVKEVDRCEEDDLPLPGDVPVVLHHIFDADLRHLLTREKQTTNVTCMQPDEAVGIESKAKRLNYIMDDGCHKDLPLAEGRRCEGGECCDKCSRNIFPTFATDVECNLEKFPELSSLTFNNLGKVRTSTILMFVRLIERVRRTIAQEYGLPLSLVLPLQAYSRKYVAGTTQKGGGGGEGDFVILHTDEATHSGYHYSCVLYLSTQGEDFEGGNFVFNDPVDEGDKSADIYDEDNSDGADMSLADAIRLVGRKLTPFHPTKGAAVIFSSGWENMHEVETITSGTRYAVPCFFTTCPVPDAAYDQMVQGKPKTNEDIADDWLHLLLAHREESPVESVGRVKELLMKWHYMCAPLTSHN